MKILYVGHTYTVSANHAKLRALAALPNVEIALITPQGWTGPLYSNKTDRLTGLSNLRHYIVKAYGIGKEGAYFYHPSVARIVRDFQPDVIHVEQGAYAISFSQILMAARRWSPMARAVFFTWWNLPYHPRTVKGLTERFNLKRSAGAVAGNRDAAEILRDHGFEGNITILPQLGIELQPSAAPTRREASRPLRVGYVGRVEEEKGVLDLVEAIAATRSNVRLVVVGAGSALDEMKRRAAVKPGSFEFHPPVRNEQVEEYLRQLDVLVLPSRSTPEWVEQFGHILLEAMAMGVTVVGSSSGEIPNVIGDAGRIFTEGNVAALRQTIEELEADEDDRLALATAAIARVRDRFTNDVIARKQFAFYELLVKEGRSVSDDSAAATKPREEFSLV